MSLSRERLPEMTSIIPHELMRAEMTCVDLGNGHTSQTTNSEDESILIMTPEALTRTVEDFLAGARDAVVLDDGAVLFDLAQAKYSISGERNKCLLHLWSEERNLVRRVLDVEVKNEVLRLAVQRLRAVSEELPKTAGPSTALRSGRDETVTTLLIFLARLPADGVHPRVEPGDMRCDRLPARLPAEWFGLLP